MRPTEQGPGLGPAANYQNRVLILWYRSLDPRDYCYNNNASPRTANHRGRLGETDAMDQDMREEGHYFGHEARDHLRSRFVIRTTRS